MSRPTRRSSRIRPPHRGRTPSASFTNRLTHEVQPFVRPAPPRTGGIKYKKTLITTDGPVITLPPKEQIALLLVVLALLVALVFIQMNSYLIAH